MRRYRVIFWLILILLALAGSVIGGAGPARPLRKYTVTLAPRADSFIEVEFMAKELAILESGLSRIGMGPVKVSREEDKFRAVFISGVAEEEVRTIIEAPRSLNFRLDGRIAMNCDDLEYVKPGTQDGQVFLSFSLGPKATEDLARLTRENVGKAIAVCLGESVLMEPVVQEPIADGRGRIMLGGAVDAVEASTYAAQMELAALPIPLRIVSLRNETPDPLAALTSGPLGTVLLLTGALILLAVIAIVAVALILRRANRRAEELVK